MGTSPADQHFYTQPGSPVSQSAHGRQAPKRKRGAGKTILLSVLGLVGVIVAISIVAAALSGGGATTPTGGSSAVTEPVAEEPASDAPERAQDNPAFGQAVTFEDNSTLTCGKPVAFEPDQYAAGGENSKVHFKIKCTFRNKSDKTFDPALSSGSMSAGGEEGESVYQDGLDAPDNPVLPGKSVTWWMGYGVNSKQDVQVTVSLGFLDYKDVTFS